VVLGSPEGPPKVFAGVFMLLRSLQRGGSCPDSGVCPTLCRPRDAVLLPPASAPTCHQETHPPPAFFVALHAASVPAGCSFVGTASAHLGTHSGTASRRFRSTPARRHPPVSSLSASQRLVPLSAVRLRDLPAHESLFSIAATSFTLLVGTAVHTLR
jgi:hypothetical protein